MLKILENTAAETVARSFLALTPWRWRHLDREFHSFRSRLRANELKPLAEMRYEQFHELRRIVTDAYQRLPFYKEKYDAAGFAPRQLKDPGDIGRIPPLTKDELRALSASMEAGARKMLQAYTSGTTGKAITIYTDRRALARELASIYYQWERIGYQPTDGRIELRGFLPEDCDYRWFPDMRILRINVVRLSERNLDAVAEQIRKSGYRFLHGYPSALYKLARLMEIKGGVELRPHGILLASEVLYDWQLAQIERVFPAARKIAHYGQAEHVALGAWEATRQYHCIPTYGLCESGADGEIIGTGFTNEVMPLIRYRTSDVAQGYSDAPLGAKALFPVIDQVLGRQEDMTYTATGDMVPPAVVTFPFKQLRHVRAAKLIQHDYGRFQLLLESPGAREAQADETALVEGLRAIYGEAVRIEVEHTPQIAVDRSGKFRWIECRLPAQR